MTPGEIAQEIGARLREELDYHREAKHVALYGAILAGEDNNPCACVASGIGSTRRLLTLDWLRAGLLEHTYYICPRATGCVTLC